MVGVTVSCRSRMYIAVPHVYMYLPAYAHIRHTCNRDTSCIYFSVINSIVLSLDWWEGTNKGKNSHLSWCKLQACQHITTTLKATVLSRKPTIRVEGVKRASLTSQCIRHNSRVYLYTSPSVTSVSGEAYPEPMTYPLPSSSDLGFFTVCRSYCSLPWIDSRM